MAKIQSKDVVQQDLFKNTIESGELLVKTLDDLEGKFKEILKTSEQSIKNTDPLAGFENAEKIKDELVKVNKATEQLGKIDKERAKINKQLNSLRDDEVKGKLRLQKANKDQRDILKAQLVLQDAEAGTLEILAARNKLLRIERVKLNLDTKEGADRLKAINKELDENNKTIKDNSDQLKKQRINVGNYANSIIEATDRLKKQESALSKNIKVLKQQDNLTEDARKELVKYETELVSVTRELKDYGEETEEASEETAGFEDVTGELGGAMGELGGTVGTAAGGIRRFVKSLARNPVLAFAAAIGALFGAFTQTNEGSLETRKTLLRLKATFDVVLGSVGALAGGIFNLFAAFAGGGSIFARLKRFDEATKQITSSFDDFGKKLAESIEIAEKVAIAEFALAKSTRIAVKEIARLNGLLELQQLIADDVTRSFREREEAAGKALITRRRLAFAEVSLAKEELAILDDQVKLRQEAGLEAEDLLTAQAEAQAKVIELEQSLTVAVADNEKTRRELKQDRLERDLDFEIDVFDSLKTLNERRLKDDRLTFSERQRLLDDTTKLADESFANQQETIGQFTEAQLDFNELVEESNERVIRERVRGAEFSEIIEGRAIEIIKERRLALQDLADAQRDLDKERAEAAEAEVERQEELRVELVEKQFDTLEAITEKTVEEIEKRQDARLDAANREVSLADSAVAAQEARAAQGLDNTLAFEREKQAEAELNRQKLKDQQKKAQERELFIETTLTALRAAREASPPEPPGKAIIEGLAQTRTIIAIADQFFDGVDSTGTVRNGLDSNGGRVAILHDNERIYNAKQTAEMDSMGFTNRDSTIEALRDYKNMTTTGVSFSTPTVVNSGNRDLLAGMIMLNDTMQKKNEYSIQWDTHGNMIQSVMSKSMTKTVKHVTRKPRL